ncbi:MAG: hypothetical protein K0U93_28040 [Gammaproteobacteria bacterium]|nr:hypothetical protein [Gammaproteobacteria bacterium]
MRRKRPFWSLSIRSRVVLLSIGLFVIPLIGLRYVQQMETSLRQGLTDTVESAAQAIAGALNGQENVFANSSDDGATPQHDIYVYDLDNAITVDGFASDWVHYKEQLQPLPLANREPVAAPNEVRYIVGQQADYLYILFEVTDTRVVFGLTDSLGQGLSDHIRIDIESGNGRVRTYLLESQATGWLTANEATYRNGKWFAQRAVSWLTAEWTHHAGGYTVEVRIPKLKLGPRLALTVVDVDDLHGDARTVAHSTLGAGEQPMLGRVITHSPVLQGIIANLNRTPGRRVRIVDQFLRVRAQGGSLSTDVPAPRYPLLYRVVFRGGVLPPLEPVGAYAGVLPHDEIGAALLGETASAWRSGLAAGETVVSAAAPVWSQGRVVGAAFVEQSAESIQSLRDGAMTNLVNTALLTAAVSAPLLIFFVSNVVRRLRRLRRRAETAIDSRGRVIGGYDLDALESGPRARDEIGDIEESLQEMLMRLQSYHDYLEQLAARLSHELRTPIAIVRSSLDNLADVSEPNERAVFTQRAMDGLDRLSAILTRMSEASRLDEALQGATRERIDLAKLVEQAAAGYRLAWPDRTIEVRTARNVPIPICGAPDLVLQMLDKIVSNAVEFSKVNTPVVVGVSAEGGFAVVAVDNVGMPISKEVSERAFEPLVSIRSGSTGSSPSETPHLGIGLFIARIVVQFHAGSIDISNSEGGNGVTVTARFPSPA